MCAFPSHNDSLGSMFSKFYPKRLYGSLFPVWKRRVGRRGDTWLISGGDSRFVIPGGQSPLYRGRPLKIKEVTLPFFRVYP